MQMQDQSATIEFIRSAGALASVAVDRIDTHISTIILAGDRVFKLKRAVKFAYLDFSTPELRLAACETELQLNRRTASSLYLGVRRITRERDGALCFDGTGALTDAIVEMRRFDQADLFDVMAREGRLNPALLTELARIIALFHESLPVDHSRSGAQAVEAALHANEGGLAQVSCFGRDDTLKLVSLCRKQYETFRAILLARGRAGRVRRCHGDLHLRNICMFEGKPVLFDCLEFDEDLATTDVLYDLAFLLMDLVHLGLANETNLVFNRYIDETGDDDALALMPFFMAIRAAVRAHVGAAGAQGNAEKIAEAKAYFNLAIELLEKRGSRLVAIGGLSGSGKSSVAAGLAAMLDLPPGARILSTDRIRKKLAGIGAEEKLPAEAYTRDSSTLVYAEQREQAARVLAGEWSAIAEGVFLKAGERDGIRAIAIQCGAKFDGLWLDAPPDVLRTRVAARVNDPSDATIAVLETQFENNPGALDWQSIDASGSLALTAENALRKVG